MTQPSQHVRSRRVALLILCCCAIASAQEQQQGAGGPNQSSTATPGSPAGDPGPSWHLDFTAYLWFPGAHGTLGTPTYNADFRASPGDLLSHFRFGLMGAVKAERGRFVLISDVVWVRLRSTNTTTYQFLGPRYISAETKADQVVVTPEVGYRFVNGEKLKGDWLVGVRYWHLNSSLQLTSPRFGFAASGSRDWADPVMGFRFQFPLSGKLGASVLADAGGIGIGSELDYQVVSAISYRLSSKVGLGVGYRYLYVNYRPRNFIFDAAQSGAMVGLNYTIK